MLANYHTHTDRCGHAEGEDKAFVESAIDAGMKVLGFSDHCPWVFPDNTVSHCRMFPSELDDYMTSLTRLREEYRKDITIYIGFESEYLPTLLEAQEQLFKGYPIDYQILGQHFIEPEPFGEYCGKITADRVFLQRYIDSCIAGMETGRYKYLAHPDLLGFSGMESVYAEEYGRLCAYLQAHDIPVEINLLGVVGGRHYTDPRFLRIAGEYGCKAIIGCDAHTPDRLHYTKGIRQCIHMAEKAGLELVTYLPGLEPQ